MILRQYQCTLNNAKIYGAIAISRYSFLMSPNVWRAFIELWGSLANTFHHSSGEMGISLYDMKVIGGSPILWIPYEEFIPLNAKLMKGTMRNSIVAELLRTNNILSIRLFRTLIPLLGGTFCFIFVAASNFV